MHTRVYAPICREREGGSERDHSCIQVYLHAHIYVYICVCQLGTVGAPHVGVPHVGAPPSAPQLEVTVDNLVHRLKMAVCRRMIQQ